jgi:hypothetical protein
MFESKSRRLVSGRLSVEHLEVRLTPDAKTVPAFHDFAIGISENTCAANSITLVDDIRLQQNSTNYRSSQVYFSSNDASAFSASAFQLVNKLDDVALQAASTKGVVLIDSSLVATIPVDELKGSLVVSIDGNRDVVSQITTALEGLANVPVLRIISHGNDGVLYFGNQAFDSRVLTASATQVASWGNSLTSDADILLYGCSIANTDAGKAFVEQFASITQADIGASSNLTGKGGDEVLEFHVGQVSNTLIASTIDYNSANLSLEPGDSFNTAIPLSAITGGFGADGSISAAGEEDYYSFTATATGVVEFTMNAIDNSSVDSILTIYDSNFGQLARNDDSNPTTLNSFISLNVTAGSIYYIKATAYVSTTITTGTTGEYRVSATLLAPPGSSFDTAIPLSAITGGFGADGDIFVDGEEDYYTFTATATGVLQASLDQINGSSIDTFISIYDSSRTFLGDDDDDGPGLNSLASVSVIAGHVYFVTAATAYGSGTGAYRVTIVAPIVTLNTANLASNATTLTIAGTGFNTIAANNTVTLSSGTGTVTNATANQLTITFTTLPSASGSLTAIINSFGSTSGSPVQVATIAAAPPGSSFGTAIALTAQQGSTVASFDGDINPAYNADYYIYTAAATGVVNFAMAAVNNSGVDSILTIYDSNFVQIARIAMEALIVLFLLMLM